MICISACEAIVLVAPKPANEKERINALVNLEILDTPINPVFERITRITKQMFGVPVVAISIIDSERQWFKSTQGLNVCENDLSSSFCSHAILQNDIFVVPDSLQDPRFADNPCVNAEPYVRFYAGCPVKTEDGFNVGTLCIIDSKPREFTKEQLESLRDMASLVQDELQKFHIKHSQLEVIKELDKAKRARLIDGLTGVWNREGTEINLRESVLLAQAQKYNLMVGIYDIDNFKHVNDTYGHNAGDEVIREVCKTMVINLDDHDIVGRWGGEEFVIIAKIEADADQVFKRIDNARAQVCATPILFEDKQIPVSITVGLTIYDHTTKRNNEEIIGSADEALYRGKTSGKNKCEINHGK